MQDEIKEILIDSESGYKRAKEFLSNVMPGYKRRVKRYNEKGSMFERYHITSEIEKLLTKKVTLKSGGYLIIESTEAMVTIDVNSGTSKNAENTREMILQTNIEAAKEIARQLRLRDLGGLVMLDLIDMDKSEDRKEVEKAFLEALKKDRAKISVLPISPLGVLEMTRQRIRQSLKASVFTPCPNCKGTGMTMSLESLGLSIMRHLRGMLRENKGTIETRMQPRIAAWMNNERRGDLAQIESECNSKVIIKTDITLPFDRVEYKWVEKRKNKGN
jgi:ribonuclease E